MLVSPINSSTSIANAKATRSNVTFGIANIGYIGGISKKFQTQNPTREAQKNLATFKLGLLDSNKLLDGFIENVKNFALKLSLGQYK